MLSTFKRVQTSYYCCGIIHFMARKKGKQKNIGEVIIRQIIPTLRSNMN